ncbi:hypothetical protein Val02_66730 [Virgisporangium aliadipatigenens]|uniref:Nudix hydrolase domain-containing protein n=1 Tax=Virgisporangium aliadipatigenens TaxID=741659 RepID=A0A8J3YSE9_9ACTN|nr:NUDIX domain-containing protein [Virgisporangium aliadipatigenens]GIJ49787.1 hypothetical protein Val02_66730 [Virgisporangium aliadipatigenens]
MPNQRAQVDVHLILRRGDEILLGLRKGTGWADGHWHLPSGHGEDGEPATAATAREAVEELGITVDPADLRLVHVVHHHTDSARLAFFFETSRWSGEPVNAEPHKCADLAWFPLAALPTPTIPYARHALDLYPKGETYSELGWPEPAS